MKKLNLLTTTLSLALLLNVTLPAANAEAAGSFTWTKIQFMRIFHWHGFTIQPSKTVTEPAPQPQPVGQAKETEQTGYALNAFETEVVKLVNAERAKYNLAPLNSNTNLAKVARLKSQDMRDNNYFSHQSPTYGSPFDMMKKFGITYRTAGENIAAGQDTPAEVVKGWMNSEGHRKNILSPNFTDIGVGYVTGGSYGTYWTQQFIGK